MNIREIRDRAAWERLKPIWNPLLAESPAATTFLTWEYLNAWWSAYGTPEDLRILVAADDSGIIRGLAPLRLERIRRYGQTYNTLRFLGDGSNDSDYLDFIVARGYEVPVIDAWMEHLRPELDAGLLLRLHEIPAGSTSLPVLKAHGEGQLWQDAPIACATAQLPGSWDAYVATLKPRFRTKIRSVLRTLEAQPGVRFGFCRSASELDRLLPALFDLHTRRWNQDGRPGVFGWDRKREFYRELSPRLLDRGALRLSWLEWNGRLLAIQYGFVHGNTYLHLQEGYEPASEHWNVGVGLRAWSIREMIGAGLSEYDFLAGVGRHKTDWGGEIKESRQILVAAPTYRNVLFCRGPEWRARLKEAIRPLVPERVLALRHTPGHSDAGASPDQGSTGMIRNAVARCYFHLGMPAAAQRLRSRYQLSVGSRGRLPHVALTRRQQPAGRIFCYHRVNDDRDPFFPAMPTATFERQMRFVTRHYRVVSLADMLRHLESGSPETVIALTFDDGYRDNYLNALPIMQRYGVPATVFLTTGCLDSGERPWFEQLAAAVKSTAREYIDIEIDLPRRCWMRTPQERLHSSQMLFGLLRQTGEAERRQHLDALFKALSPPGLEAATDVMLTWDQVRQMNQHGIDFGGHSVTHPLLSKVTADQLQWEVAESKRRIEAEIQKPVRYFAYPNGRVEDFGPSTKDAVRAAGYEAAMTTLWGLNYSTTDRLELRRSGPWEEDEALFAYKMDWYELVNG